MKDPTYNKAEIQKNKAWCVAFVLSEVMNYDAPIGWSKYIPIAECLLDAFEMKSRRK